MRILLHTEIEDDLKKCEKKGWYVGLREELPRVYRLLKSLKNLPGESPLRHMGEKWGGRVKHARIVLPKENTGKRQGARLAYVITESENCCRIVYVGGHKDKRYDDSLQLSKLILERLQDELVIEWIDKNSPY